MKRVFPLLLALALVAPVAAHAGNVTMVARDVSLGPRALQSANAPMRFNMIGLHWQGSGTVEYRTRSAAGVWRAWAAADSDSGISSATGRGPGWYDGNLDWVGASRGIQFRTSPGVSKLRAYYLWSRVTTSAARRSVSTAGLPSIVPRSGWEADEKITRAEPRFAPELKLGVIHHTAGSNAYTPAQAAAIVRGIEVYHVKANGWNDIGYNFLVDRFGTVYEGRGGGADRNVIGAHSLGFNSGATGVALMGNFTRAVPPPVMQSALVGLLAWRLDVAHVDPLSTTIVTSAGNPKFKLGKHVTLRAISAHRDTGPSECPGDRAYALLPALTKRVSLTGLPKLYSPVVSGLVGGSVRFQGRLSSALSWTVKITDPAGVLLAKGSGRGPTVDWTWSSAGAGTGPFNWTIEAGAKVFPATGTIGAAKPKPKPMAKPNPQTKPAIPATPPPPLAAEALTALTATPAVISPSADGTGGYVSVDFTLAVAAAVTVTLKPTPPLVVASRKLLAAANLPAGDNSFSWSLNAAADGRYEIVVTAKPKVGAASTLSVPIAVDRSLSGFFMTSSLISPNGDGVNDTTTFGFTVSQFLPVEVLIERAGVYVGTVFSGQLGPGPQTVAWDGTIGGIRVPDGTYDAVVLVTTATGTTSFKLPITLDAAPPALILLDAATLRFSLSEAATVTVTVNGQVVVRPQPAGVFTLPWQGGPVTSISASASDTAGNSSTALTFP